MCLYLPSLVQVQGTFSGSAILHVFHVKQQEVPDNGKEKNLLQTRLLLLHVTWKSLNKQFRLIGLKESLGTVENIERNLHLNL